MTKKLDLIEIIVLCSSLITIPYLDVAFKIKLLVVLCLFCLIISKKYIMILEDEVKELREKLK